MRIRKNIYNLSEQEILSFVKGIDILKEHGTYDNYIQTLFTNMQQVDHTPMSLPWQQAFLVDFESRMQQALNDPTFALPYWDWTADVEQPNNQGPLWNATLMGGAGTPVPDGPFRGGNGSTWQTFSPDNDKTMVPWLNRTLSGTFVTRSQVQQLFSDLQYSAFRKDVSDIQDLISAWIGGQMASVPNAVNDPVFWLHLANVDRLWTQWQQFNPWAPLADPADPSFSQNSLIPPTYLNSGSELVFQAMAQFGSTYTYESFTLQCVHVGGNDDNRLFWTTFDQASQSWAEDTSFSNGNLCAFEPALATLNGTLYCVHRGNNNTGLWWTTFDPTTQTWAEDIAFTHGNRSACGPAMATLNGTLYCVHRGQGDNEGLYWTTFDPATQTWAKDIAFTHGNRSFYTPALAILWGTLYCVHRGQDQDEGLWWTTFDPATQTWAEDTAFSHGNQSDYGPALVVIPGNLLLCIHQYNDGDTGSQLYWTSFDSEIKQWPPDTLLGSGSYPCSGSPAVAALNGIVNATAICVHRGSGSDEQLKWTGRVGENWQADTPFSQGNQSTYGAAVTFFSW